MKMMIPFSYVIFVWYLLFITDIFPYNPFWWLCIALFFNILQLSAMIYYQNDRLYIFLFCFLNLFIKILPIFFLRSYYYKKIQIKTDLLPGLVLFVFYIFSTFFLILDGSYQTANQIINKYINAIKTNRPFSPFIYYVSQWLRS